MLIPRARLAGADLYQQLDWFREAWNHDPTIAQSGWEPGRLHEEGGYALERLRANLRQLPDEHRRRCLILLGQWLTGEVQPATAYTRLRLAISEWDAERKGRAA